VLGLREGSTEVTLVVASLLSGLVERGLDADRTRPWVIDGGKALRKAIVQTFGQRGLIQRRQEHKRGNVLEHLPDDIGRYFTECDARLQAVLAERSRASVELGKKPKAGMKTRSAFDIR
jgi:hypothetical protein